MLGQAKAYSRVYALKPDGRKREEGAGKLGKPIRLSNQQETIKGSSETDTQSNSKINATKDELD